MRERDVTPEYVELVDPDTLQPCAELTREALLLVAARIGDTRLIDNAQLRPTAVTGASRRDQLRPANQPRPGHPDPRKALA